MNRVLQHVCGALAGVGAGSVGTLHGNRTNIVLTFVNVLTTLWCFDKSRLARTLTVQALFSGLAICILATARVAHLVHANFSLQTVLVGVANLKTHAIDTLFTPGAMSVIQAIGHAVTLVASLSFRTLLCASIRDPDATLLRGWYSSKSGRASADIPTIWTLGAIRVRTTGDSACILALIVDALERS